MIFVSRSLKNGFLLLFLLMLWGEMQAQIDTLEYETQAVTILDSVEAEFRTDSEVTLFRRDSLGIYDIVGTSADAVLKQAEGLYIRNYGGHGGLKSVSIRGFSTQQTTVTFNGLPYPSPQTGSINFGNFYPDGYNEIEVRRSANDATYNALGGNINFEMKPEGRSARFKVGIGRYGEWLADVHADYQIGKNAFRVAYHYLEAEDNFPFDLNGEEGTRQNAEFETQQYQLFWGRNWRPNIKTSVGGIGFWNDQNVPGPVIQGNPLADSTHLQQRHHFSFIKTDFLKKQYDKAFLSFRTTLSISHLYDELEYAPLPSDQRYEVHDVLAQLSFHHLFPHQSLKTNFQYNYSYLTGNNLAIDFRPVASVQREQAHAGLSHHFFLSHPNSSATFFKLNSIVRANYVDWETLLWNAGLNLSLKPLKEADKWELFAHGNYGNRLPSFNELYYFGYGNADLKPEKVISADVGTLYRPKFWVPLSLKLSYFWNRTEDKIISVPINPAIWRTFAIGLTQTKGFEFALEVEPLEGVRMYYNHTIQDAVDMTREGQPLIPYTPPEIINYGVKWSVKGFDMQVNGNYSGWRYSLLENSEDSFLPAFHVMDLSLGYLFSSAKIDYKLMIQAENLLNANYQVIRSYPMPPLMYRVVYVMRIKG